MRRVQGYFEGCDVTNACPFMHRGSSAGQWVAHPCPGAPSTPRGSQDAQPRPLALPRVNTAPRGTSEAVSSGVTSPPVLSIQACMRGGPNCQSPARRLAHLLRPRQHTRGVTLGSVHAPAATSSDRGRARASGSVREPPSCNRACPHPAVTAPLESAPAPARGQRTGPKTRAARSSYALRHGARRSSRSCARLTAFGWGAVGIVCASCHVRFRV